MKFLAKGKTERIVEDSEEKVQGLLKTFRHNLQNKYNRYAFIFFSLEVKRSYGSKINKRNHDTNVAWNIMHVR